MASKKRKRLSVWGILARLGLTGDHDDIIQHVFEMASRVTVRSDDGDPLRGGSLIDGDDSLVGMFEDLGTTKTWPGCGSPETCHPKEGRCGRRWRGSPRVVTNTRENRRPGRCTKPRPG